MAPAVLRTSVRAVTAPRVSKLAAKPPAIPAKARVAVIGDSHTAGAFGSALKERLAAYLKTGGGKLQRFTGIPSAGVSHYLTGSPTQAGSQSYQTPSLDQVLKGKPDVLVVALGTNMLFNSVDGNKAQIRALLAKADKAGTRVVWVGPPDVHGYGGNLAGGGPEKRFYTALRQVNAERKEAGKPPVRIIDSRPSTRETDTVDGLHFGTAAAKAWAKQVFQDAT